VQPGSTIYETYISTKEGPTHKATLKSVETQSIYETSISIKEGPTHTATFNSVETLTESIYSVPIQPVTAPPTLTLTRTLPGEIYTSFVTSSCIPTPPATITLTRTSFYTAPGYNHSVVRTSIISHTVPGPTIVNTAPGSQTTLTEYRTKMLPGSTLTVPGGKSTLTEYATRTLPGSTITSVINHPGENSTITTTETTTCYETVSTCSVTPVSPPRGMTIYETNYITKTLPTTYTAYATCSDSTVTITASSKGWDKSGGYESHSSHYG